MFVLCASKLQWSSSLGNLLSSSNSSCRINVPLKILKTMFSVSLSFSFSGWALWIKIACCFLFYTKRSRLGEGEGSVGAPNNFPRWVRVGLGLCQNIVRYTGRIKPPLTCFQPFLDLFLSFFKLSLNLCKKRICSVDCHNTKLQTPACWVWCEWGAIIPKSQ